MCASESKRKCDIEYKRIQYETECMRGVHSLTSIHGRNGMNDEHDVKIDRQRGLKFFQQGSSKTITNVNVAED